MTYQQLGNWEQAQKHIEASLQILQQQDTGNRKKYLKVYASNDQLGEITQIINFVGY